MSEGACARRRGWAPLLLTLLVAVAVLCLDRSPAAAQSSGQAVTARRYDSELAVQQGGDVLVRETLEIDFQGGPFQQGYRRIPLARVEGIRDIAVEEAGSSPQAYRPGNGQPYTYAATGPAPGGGSGRGDALIQWWFPATRNAVRTFVVSYRAVGAVRFYPGGDQLRWDVSGGDRPYPVQSSTVTLRLPQGVSVPREQWLTDLYPQRFLRGSAANPDGTVTWQVAGVPANQSFETRAQWPHGLVSGSPPSWQAAADAEDWRNENLGPILTLAFGAAAFLIPVFGGLGVLALWYTRGRDPNIGKVPQELDSPPSELAPALVGTVVDEYADAPDAVATVLDLARRGVLGIREVPRAAPGTGRDFELHLLRDRPSLDPTLRPYERLVLDSLFTRGPQVRLSEVGGWFQFAVPRIQKELYREVVAAGLFVTNPEAERQRFRTFGTILIVAGIVAGIASCAVAPGYAAAVPWPFFAVALVGLLLRLVANRMPRRTAAGALEAARWRAYGRYLQKAEPVRMSLSGGAPAGADGAATATATATSQVNGSGQSGGVAEQRATGAAAQGATFEHTLPYAAALGLARPLVEKFAQANTPAPRWLEPPVVVGGPPMPYGPFGPVGRLPRRYQRGWGGGTYVPGPYVGPFPGGPGAPRPPNGGAPGGGQGGGGGGGLQGWSNRGAGGLQGASGSLIDLLNAAAEAMSHGGGSRWSGGGGGGGGFGGGGGGSGGGGSGFS